jgi:uncharacterized protein (DUF952 family)
VARLYRIVSAEEWRALERDGEFRGAAHDVRDGFVHLSAAHQVAVTLSAHYPGRPGLLLLAVDADALGSSSGAAVKWEVSRGGALFPHLYGALSASAVVAATPLALDACTCSRRSNDVRNHRRVLASYRTPAHQP